MSGDTLVAALATTGLEAEEVKLILAEHGLSEAEIETTMATISHTAANTGAATATGALTGATTSLGLAFKGLWTAIISNPIMALVAVLGVAFVTINKVKQANEEAEQAEKERHDEQIRIAEENIKKNNEELKSLQDSISEYNKYKDVTHLTTDEKERLMEIQQSLINKYGEEGKSIDLINGKYDEQIQKLEELERKTAKESLVNTSILLDDAIANANDNITPTFNNNVYKGVVKETDVTTLRKSLNERYQTLIDFINKYEGLEGELTLHQGHVGTQMVYFADLEFELSKDSSEKMAANAKKALEDLEEFATKPDNAEIIKSDTFIELRSWLNEQYTHYSQEADKVSELLNQKAEEVVTSFEATIDGRTYNKHNLNSNVFEEWKNQIIEKYKSTDPELANAIEQYINDTYSEWIDLANEQTNEKMSKLRNIFSEGIFAQMANATQGNVNTTNAQNAIDEFVGWLDSLPEEQKTVLLNLDFDKDEIKDKLIEMSEGGNVDLTLRPVIDTEELLNAGWDVMGGEAATVFSNTFSNETGTLAMNFTPIISDAQGNYKGVLSPRELEDYAMDVINGVREDDLNLQIGATFNGDDAIDQASIAAEQIHELQESFYLKDFSQFSLQDWKAYLDENFSHTLADKLNKEFIESVDTYTEKIESLRSALDDFEKGELDSKDLRKLQKDFPELIGHTKDFDVAVRKLLGDLDTDIMSQFEKQFGNLNTEDDIQQLQNWMDEVHKLTEFEDIEFSLNIETETKNMSNLFSAMKESVSSIGLSADAIKNLKDRYKDLEEYDVARLFEKSTNGIHLNTTALREFENAYEDNLKETNNKKLSDLVKQYNDLTEAIGESTDAFETADLYKQRKDIQDRIQDTAELAAQYEGLTSAFYDWEQAQSIGEEGDMYDSLAGGLEKIKELYEDGLVGTNKFRTAVQLMSNEDLSNVSVDELVSVYEKNYDIMTRYFTDSEAGCNNFLQDLQAINAEWAHVNENGVWEVNFGLGNDQEIADALGMNIEAVQSILRKAHDFGFEVNLDTVYSAFDYLETEAEKANNKLIELGKTTYRFNFETDNIDVVNEDLKHIQAIVDSFKDKNGKIDLRMKGAEEAQTVLTTLMSKKQTLCAPDIMKLDMSSIMEANQDLGVALQTLRNFVSTANDLQIQTSMGLDTTVTQRKLQNVAGDIENLPKEIKTELGLDDEKFNETLQEIQNAEIDFKAGVGIDEDALVSVQKTLGTIKDKDIQILTNAASVDHELDNINDYVIDDKKFAVILRNNPLGILAQINSFKLDDKSFKLNVLAPSWVTSNSSSTRSTGIGSFLKSSFQNITGSSKVDGTAYNNGNYGKWGAKNNGIALMGELGRELLIHNGEYRTVGENGAEFVKYHKNDIIFNHKQTEELLGKGKTTSDGGRGKSFAEGTTKGTAFSNASGSTWFGKIFTSISTKNGKYDSNGKKSSSSTSSSTNKKDEVTYEKIDWIEIALKRLSETVDKFKRKADSIYSTFTTRNKYLSKEISTINKQIQTELKGADRYAKEAANVGLRSDLAEKVRNGTIDIRKYNSDTAEKIEEYKKWYQAYLDCKDAAQELRETVKSLYQQRFENTITKWNNALIKLQHTEEKLNAAIDRRTSSKTGDYVTTETKKSAYTSNIMDYKKIISNEKQQMTKRKKELADLKKQFNNAITNGGIKKGSEYYYEMLSNINEIENEIDNLNQSIIDNTNNIAEQNKSYFDAIANNYSNKLALIEKQSQEYNNVIAIQEAKGYEVSKKYYELLKAQEQKNVKQLIAERDKLTTALNKAVGSGAIKSGSNAWYEMKEKIADVTLSIQTANKAIVDYNNSIRQADWSVFDLIQERVSNITNETQFLIELMSSKDLYNDKGQLSNEGMATMGLYGADYNVYMEQANSYAKELQKIDRQIASDTYNQTLIDRRKELLELQQKSIKAAESEKQSIKKLVKDGIDLELKSLKGLIDEYEESLQNQKDLYDYQKKLSNQSKTIADLNKQLSAYEGDTSEENRARLQKIKVELSNAQDQLSETQNDKYLSDQKKMLDTMYNEYETILNARLDNLDLLIADMITKINENRVDIKTTLQEQSNAVGYTISKELDKVWQTNNVLSTYQQGIKSNTSAISTAVALIRQDVNTMMAKMNNSVTVSINDSKTNRATTKITKSYATGSRRIDKDMNAWTQENGLKEAIIRPSDGAVLTPLAKGDTVLNNAATDNLFRFTNDPTKFIKENLISNYSTGSTSSSVNNNSTSINLENVNFNLPNVKNYDEFFTAMQSDKRFEQMVQSMTVGRMMGQSKYNKYHV